MDAAPILSGEERRTLSQRDLYAQPRGTRFSGDEEARRARRRARKTSRSPRRRAVRPGATPAPPAFAYIADAICLWRAALSLGRIFLPTNHCPLSTCLIPR